MKKVLNQNNAIRAAIGHLEEIKSEYKNPHVLFQDRNGVKKMNGGSGEAEVFKTVKEAKEFYNIKPDEPCIILQECRERGDREYYDSLKE